MTFIDDVAFVLRGKNRRRILEAMSKGERISAQVEKEMGMYKTHVNRTFRELKGRRLISCKNPKDRYYQTYRITKHGKEVLKKIKEIKKQ